METLVSNTTLTLAIVFCIVIGSAAVLTWVWTVRFARLARARVDGVRAVLANVPRPVTAQHRTHLLAAAQERGGEVSHLWSEYDETLVADRHGRLLNTLDADYYFRTETLAPELLHNRVLAIMPSLLTVTGVLGTFLGLTLGLQGIDFDGTTDELTAGVRELISGASLAFITSVAGVLASLITQIVAKMHDRSVEKVIHRLQVELDEIFEKQTSEASLVSIMNSSSASEEYLAGLGEQIGRSLQEAVAPAMQRMAEQAAQQSEQVFEHLVDRFSSGFEELGRTLAERLDASSATLSQTIEYLGDKLAQQADEHNERMEELRAATARQVELLDERLPRVVEALEEATARLDAVSEHLAPSAENLRVTAESFEATSTAFRDVLADSVEAFEEISAKHNGAANSIAALTERLDTLAETTVSASDMLKDASGVLHDGLGGLREHQEKVLAGMKEQQSSFLDGLRSHQTETLEKLSNEVDGFRSALASWFVEYSKAVQEQTNARMNAWNEQTHAYTSSMLDAARALSAAVEEIDDALSRRADQKAAA
ncbi:MotA/TolQ/ExbB proton channel family protein [Isoptericola variabilis J7]|uniref:MotA/TolQ/ExbB proton channel domain-containing protein n=1 Tax=Isoptericola variabilis (strain 225) TaxID=743718 RepID=F6FPD7_ISOV2|nr:hypothetical protein Isova_0866 [Isoptericola variabilis 225]TWH27331.1 MotA/TolQ/ExbB proton channel family protein [Isoptericola variabilis J7]TWH31981.1 MotA/TolQ/ExbB proton channel family protein [Isoptericola variabilis J7]